MVKPSAIAPGARVGIAAPAGPFEAEPFARGVGVLRAWGFEPVVPAGIEIRNSTLQYLAGGDAFRAETLERLLQDPDIDAIWCARGGYGSMRILRALDPLVARANPKLVVGFSDITAIHSHLLANAGLAGLHGPNVTTLGRIEARDAEAIQLVIAGEPAGDVEDASLRAIRRGRATGPLVGGNLSVLVALVGSAYFPPVDGAILFLEDVGEKPYRIDRMLTQLHLAGVLRRAAGVVLGEFVDCVEIGTDLEAVFADRLGTLACPVVAGFPSGHGTANFPLGIGVRCDLDADAPAIRFPEPLCG